MSTEENKALICRVYEFMNRGELDALYELFDPGYVSHYTDRDMTLEQNKQLGPTFYTSFPDISFNIEHMVTEGDKVAFRETWTGTHSGEFMGITPTGRKIEMMNTATFKMVDGKLAESRATLDELRLMQQLGIIPTQ